MDLPPLKKPKVFKLAKMPRFLPGEVPDNEMIRDLKTFNQHRHRCFFCESVVDNKPPPMNPNKYIRVSRIRADAARLEQINVENKALVRKINIINRMGGKLDTFNPLAYAQCSRWGAHVTNMHYIATENKKIYKRLSSVESNYPNSDLEKEWQNNLNKLKHMARYTLQMFITKTLDQTINAMPSISNLQLFGIKPKKKKRPHCFIDFRIKDGIPMGRIIIELYNDVCPRTCENFISICNGNKGLHYKCCKVYNVVKGQYFETGDVTLNNGRGGCSIYGFRFPEETHLLSHTKPGVVSMVPVERTFNDSRFSITFEAQDHLDRKRVVFGKVVQGMKTIYHIQDLGRKVGAPIVPIIIAACGNIKRKRRK
ncbi:uncharacterized protein [Onthophagus taurus]|uniref:uncharacterized protein n=1 Tax=Onthophagus taurus TaxID=166361 RepID=UPI0039BDDCFF